MPFALCRAAHQRSSVNKRPSVSGDLQLLMSALSRHLTVEERRQFHRNRLALLIECNDGGRPRMRMTTLRLVQLKRAGQ